VRPRGRALFVLLVALSLALPPPLAAEDDDTESEEEAEEEREKEEEEEGLQQRLTEREDKRRPLEPFGVEVFGNLLTLGGEFETELGYVRNRVHEDEVDGVLVKERDRLQLETTLDLEAFYTIGPGLSAFVQIAGVWDEDLLGKTFEEVSDTYVERGEMWLYTEDVRGSGVNLDVGRLDFEDDRRWWWDDELDAARIGWEGETLELTLALAYELASDRSDQSWVDPDQERVLRWISESSWDFAENHSFQFFVLYQDDHSPTEQVGDTVSVEREDDSDAELTWLGVRQTGIFELGARGYLGYWLDAAAMGGHERLIEFGDEVVDGRIEAEEVKRHDVSGWAVDAGLLWLPPLPWEPRVFAGYAQGSEEYRQSGIGNNEAGFGGVERFDSYGLLLRPELSNIGIVTAGAGMSLFDSSSLDLVYHYYRLYEASEDLRDSELQFQMDGKHKELGHELDLVLALEEWERLEFTLAISALRTSNAFGIGDPAPGVRGPEEEGGREWVFGGFFAVRYGF
jgi:hypothetical protein